MKGKRPGLAHRGLASLLAASLATSGCSQVGNIHNAIFDPPGSAAAARNRANGFIGGVVADEPQAALVARDVLSAGGNAADAAVALAFALSVTLPSRAGLGGGGGCVVYSAGPEGAGRNGAHGTPNAVLFPAPAPASAAGSDRPAAVPMLARGLYVLHARYGSQPFENLVTPAERMARFGIPASRAFVRDLAVVAGPLADDPGARAAFTQNGQPLAEGAQMVQPDLSVTLSQIRLGGVGDMYQGALARRLSDAVAQIGGTITAADLRTARPQVVPALTMPASQGDMVAFLPPPIDGGLADAAAFEALRANPGAPDQANERALAVATRWRQGGADAKTLLAGPLPAPNLQALPASTSFATLDHNGNAVVCALTMGNLFGTGRVAPGTGVLLAASPAWLPPPLLSAALVYNPDKRSFHAAVGASGQASAPLAMAVGLEQSLADRKVTAQPAPQAAPDPGRLNIINCTGYLPGEQRSCGWATDPRGAGLAISGN
jgi:gamma-glutamyltranspeptidase/glutathione hydrolase